MRNILLQMTSRSRKDVALVKSYIKAHLSEKINLESLADMVFLSPGYLSLIFKQSTGDTVSHYIISQRIDEAKRLLETTNMKVNQICEKVGTLIMYRILDNSLRCFVE